MNQLTARGFDEELAEHIQRLSKREGISLNQAALKLLRKGAGLSDPARNADTVGPSLDHPIGSWTDEEDSEMDRALEELEAVDEADWK